jgi:hypothetical protein
MEENKLSLVNVCLQLGKIIGLPTEYHVAAIFQNNDSDEIIGWRVLTSDNKPITPILDIESLENWKEHLDDVHYMKEKINEFVKKTLSKGYTDKQ